MKKIGLLGCALMLGCATAYTKDAVVETKTVIPDDSTVIGLSPEELIKNFGQPMEKVEEGCTVPTRSGEVLKGEGWAYTKDTKTTRTSLQICLYKGKAVAFNFRYLTASPEGYYSQGNRDVLDSELLEKLHGSDVTKEGTSYKFSIDPRKTIMI